MPLTQQDRTKMKKVYLQPETACYELESNQSLMEESITLPVYNGGTTGGTPNPPTPPPVVEDIDSLLSKQYTLPDLWSDEEDEEEDD